MLRKAGKLLRANVQTMSERQAGVVVFAVLGIAFLLAAALVYG